MNKIYDILNTFVSECNCAAGMAAYESLPRRVKPNAEEIDEMLSELLNEADKGMADSQAQDAGTHSSEPMEPPPSLNDVSEDDGE